LTLFGAGQDASSFVHQQASDDEGLLDHAARRVEIDRKLRVFHISQEAANVRAGILIDLTFNRDPMIASLFRMNWPDPLPDR
jgi:hypothetical protein